MRNVRKKECLNESYGDIALIMYKIESRANACNACVTNVFKGLWDITLKET